MKHRLAIIPALALAGCLVDSDEPCSPGEVLNNSDFCVCADNHVPVFINQPIGAAPDQRLREGCEPCGENEIAQDGACVCDAGFVPGDTGCVPSNLGAACASNDDCTNGDQNFCAADGYCTSEGCANDDDCVGTAGYICLESSSPTFCRRPPTGEGTACAFDDTNPTAGCADQGFEAQICFPLAAGGPECSAPCDPTGDDLCSANRECCSFPFGGDTVSLCLTECP